MTWNRTWLRSDASRSSSAVSAAPPRDSLPTTMCPRPDAVTPLQHRSEPSLVKPLERQLVAARPNNVGAGAYADQQLVFHYWQVGDFLLGHHLQCVDQAGVWTDGHHVGGSNLVYEGVTWKVFTDQIASLHNAQTVPLLVDDGNAPRSPRVMRSATEPTVSPGSTVSDDTVHDIGNRGRTQRIGHQLAADTDSTS